MKHEPLNVGPAKLPYEESILRNLVKYGLAKENEMDECCLSYFVNPKEWISN